MVALFAEEDTDVLSSPAFVARCSYNSGLAHENGLDLFISWREVLGTDGYTPEVLYRFGEEDIREATWSPSLGDTVTATFVPNELGFIEMMTRWDRLAIRVKKQDGDSITASWSIAGFRDAVNPVLQQCGYSR